MMSKVTVRTPNNIHHLQVPAGEAKYWQDRITWVSAAQGLNWSVAIALADYNAPSTVQRFDKVGLSCQ